MGYFNKSKKFANLIEQPKDITPLLLDHMCLVSGDFYGIQKFIFDRLSTKNASKVIRAKSAFVQIFTEFLAKYICSEFKIDSKYILTKNAGKFEILVPVEKIDIAPIQKRLDNYFLNNFYGLSGVMLSSVSCTKDDFKTKDRYKAFRKKIIDSVEDKKFQKFNLINAINTLKYDTQINNQLLCRICNIRKVDKDESCNICNNFIKLGKRLAYDKDELVEAIDLGIEFDGFNPQLKLTNKIKSYVLYQEYSPADFETLAKNSCIDSEDGVEALAILKADVDNMGKFLEKSDVTNSFENFDKFSKTIDNFFSIYIPQLMKKEFKNTYTVFAGGDDLFLVGAWDEILKLSRKIRQEFKEFVNDDTLSISFGISLAKPSTPISYLAEHTERLLEDSKGIDKEKEVQNPKDAISLFDETVKWEEYLYVFDKLYKQLEDFKIDLNTAFLYRLLELIEMSKKVKYNNDIPSTIWKSKFRYSFNRNILEKIDNKNKEKAKDILKLLDNFIEQYPKATKMVVSEFIYKRRKS